jgi:DNA polymerase III subunit chi
MSEGGEIWFYHLERSSVEETLPPLLEKCVERGWRALVRSPNMQRIDALDSQLWTYKPVAWLPHAKATGTNDHDERQPILLECEFGKAHDQFPAIFCLDGANWDGTSNVARIFVIFDGRNEDALKQARLDWARAKNSGLAPAYWRQSEDGKWARS